MHACARRSAAVPCGGQSIKEMIDLMDLNKDGEIRWVGACMVCHHM